MKSATLWASALILAAAVAARIGAQEGEVASGTFHNSEGKEVGHVRLEHMASATIFFLDLHDLPPGVHGMHIHSVGTCTPPSFDSAGPHWNPAHKEHGSKNPKGPHAGDLQNITVGPDGKLKTQVTLEGMEQWEGEGKLLDGDGASLVIHANPDDYMTDPSGNSGPRIACAKLDLPQRQN
jgi:Cu-Zn family superoxide dismutase